MSTEYKQKLIALACALGEFEFTEETPVKRVEELEVALMARGVSLSIRGGGAAWHVYEGIDGIERRHLGATLHDTLNEAVRGAACELVAQALADATVIVERTKHGWSAQAAGGEAQHAMTWAYALRVAALEALRRAEK